MDESGVRKFLQSELSFYITVGVAILAFAANYYGLTNQINLLNQKVDYKAEQQAHFETNLDSVQALVIILDKRISNLETIHNSK